MSKRGRIVCGEPGIGAGLVAAHGNEAHGFCAAGDDDARGAGADALIGERDGFKTGGAEAIDGGARDFDGQAGAQSGHARDVQSLLAFGLSAAEDDVVDGGFLRAREPCSKARVDRNCSKIVGARGGERAFGCAANGRANGADEDGFGMDGSCRQLASSCESARDP